MTSTCRSSRLEHFSTARHIGRGHRNGARLIPASQTKNFSRDGSTPKAKENQAGIVKNRRTHLQDATPHVEQEFQAGSGHARIRGTSSQFAQALDGLSKNLPSAGTAVSATASIKRQFPELAENAGPPAKSSETQRLAVSVRILNKFRKPFRGTTEIVFASGA